MGFLDRRTISVLLTILVVAGILSLVWTARRPVIAFIFAIFFAHLLEPIVERFQGWLHLSRGKSVAVTYLVIVAGLLIFGLTVGPRIVHQATRLPGLFENVKSGQIAWQVGRQQGWSSSTEARVQNWLAAHQSDIQRDALDVTKHLAQLVSNVAWILLVPILAAFFLKDRSKLGASVVDLLSVSTQRRFLEGVLTDLDTMLAKYLWAQFLLSFFAFVAYGVFLLIVRLPYALAVGAIAGVLEFIPTAGPFLGLVLIMGTAFLTGYQHWVLLLVFWVVWRGVQDYVIYPRLMGEGLEMHPLLTIFAVLVGGAVGGVLGIFLSIPAVAALRILWINWTRGGLARKVA